MSNLIRSKEWRNILDELMQETGISMDQIADYIGVPYNGKETGFYVKLPQKRKKFIGIGMALGQPVSVINNWILRFSGKRRLYVKDISEDLIWLYLIGLNCEQKGSAASSVNYFRMYDECQNAAYMTYRQLWDEVILSSLDTSELEVRLSEIRYDEKFEGLKEFIFDNMDSFKTAYTKSRKMLDSYVNCILMGLAAGRDNGQGETRLKLNWLREFLDDSMINYLAGSSDTNNVMDRSKGVRTLSTKHIPASRRIHISMCLALGMTREEVNKYLELIGFSPLNEEDPAERFLGDALDEWDEEHPLQRKYKNHCIGSPDEEIIGKADMLKAAESMLQLRFDLRDKFAKQGLTFPYYSEKRKSE